MSTSVAIPRPPSAIGPVAILVALIAVFAFGAVSGYLVRPASPAAPARATQTLMTACPNGTHVVVFYTARTWACVAGQAALRGGRSAQQRFTSVTVVFTAGTGRPSGAVPFRSIQ